MKTITYTYPPNLPAAQRTLDKALRPVIVDLPDPPKSGDQIEAEALLAKVDGDAAVPQNVKDAIRMLVKKVHPSIATASVAQGQALGQGKTK